MTDLRNNSHQQYEFLIAWFQARPNVNFVTICAGCTARESKHLQESTNTFADALIGLGFMVYWHAHNQKHQFPI